MTVNVEGFFLCDAAHVYEGKVSVLGGFLSAVHAQALPIVLPLTLVTRLAWPYDEVGEGHAVAVEVRHDADGELIARLEAAMPRGQPPDVPYPDLPVGLNLVAPLQLHLRRPGLYSARLIVDGDEVAAARRPLKVVTALPMP
jgi:hypothetical protein